MHTHNAAKEEAEWGGKQQAPRAWIRACEGSSSDTWVDDKGVQREKEGGSPLTRMSQWDTPSVLGLVPGMCVCVCVCLRVCLYIEAQISRDKCRDFCCMRMRRQSDARHMASRVHVYRPAYINTCIDT
jgi:hypothetical protein